MPLSTGAERVEGDLLTVEVLGVLLFAVRVGEVAPLVAGPLSRKLGERSPPLVYIGKSGHMGRRAERRSHWCFLPVGRLELWRNFEWNVLFLARTTVRSRPVDATMQRRARYQAPCCRSPVPAKAPAAEAARRSACVTSSRSWAPAAPYPFSTRTCSIAASMWASARYARASGKSGRSFRAWPYASNAPGRSPVFRRQYPPQIECVRIGGVHGDRVAHEPQRL